MAPPGDVLSRCRRLVREALPAATDDLVEEVAQHFAQRWNEVRAAGDPATKADAAIVAELARWRGRAEARRSRFAPTTQLAGWATEARRALRSTWRRPAFSLASVLLTAIAIGATVTAFSVAYGLIWRPLPFPDGDRLAVVWQVSRGEDGQVSYPDYQDVTAGGPFDGATAISSGTGSLRIGDRIERVNMLWVEPSGFTLLGATPILGRLLGPDDRATPNVLISHRLWQSQLSADPGVIGRSLWLSNRDLIVVGVLAPGADLELPVGSFRLEQQDLWAVLDSTESSASRRDFSSYEALVRVRPGVALDAAQTHVDAVAARLEAAHPETNSGRGFRVAWLADEVVAAYRRPVLLASLAAVVAFLTGLANIVMLTGVHLSDRRQELAIRHALGAGVFRIRRQLLTEQALLTSAGTVAGLLLAKFLTAAITASEAAHLPRADAIRLDGPAWLAALVLALTVAAALALVPWRRGDPSTTLRAGGRSSGGSRRSQQAIVAAELALAMTLATAGALVGLSLVRLTSLDPGFEPEGVVSMRVSAYATQHPGRDDVTRFFASVIDDVRALPGVAAAGASSSLPLSGQATGTSVAAFGQPPSPGEPPLTAGWQFVTPGYFQTLGMALREGRAFDTADLARDGHVTVINDTLARVLFDDQPAVGRRISVGGDDGDWHEIVGVVADTRHGSLAEGPGPRVYDLFGQHWGRTLFLIADSGNQTAATMAAPIRRAVAAHDPEAPVFQIATMHDLLRQSSAPFRLSASMAGGLALVALVLAVAGVYATAAVSVAERRREVGVRAALGASRGELIGLIFRDGAWTALAGLAVGSAGAVAAARLVAAQLFGAQAWDAAIVIPATALAIGAAVAAATVPAALRAAGIDPLIAMRNE